MEIRVKIEDLKKVGLTLTQYITLWGLYNQVKIKYLVLDEEGFQDLIDGVWIVKPAGKDDYVLTERSIEVFEPPKGIFDEFIKNFPTRVKDVNGTVRVLSPDSPNTLAGQKLRRKWYRITGNKTEMQEHILTCLKEEVIMRSREGSLYWMRNCETWLNKCTWEDYEYLLDKPKKENGISKSTEIRL